MQGDVFRKPDHLLLFTALVGTGHQLFFLTIFVLLVSFWGTYYVETFSLFLFFPSLFVSHHNIIITGEDL